MTAHTSSERSIWAPPIEAPQPKTHDELVREAYEGRTDEDGPFIITGGEKPIETPEVRAEGGLAVSGPSDPSDGGIVLPSEALLKRSNGSIELWRVVGINEAGKVMLASKEKTRVVTEWNPDGSPKTEVFDFATRTVGLGTLGAETQRQYAALQSEQVEATRAAAVADARDEVGAAYESAIDENARMVPLEERRAGRVSDKRSQPIELEQSPREALVANLSEDDRRALEGYARAKLGKKEAQLAGNGRESIYQGQLMGQYSRDMSPAAKQVADRYAVWQYPQTAF